MSYGDYLHCAVCDCKVAYDAGTDYPGGCQVSILCAEHYKAFELKAIPRDTN